MIHPLLIGDLQTTTYEFRIEDKSIFWTLQKSLHHAIFYYCQSVNDICKLCQNFIFSRIHLLLFTWACIPLYKTIPAESLSLVRRDLFKAYWHPLGSKQPIKMMLHGYRWNITSLTVWDVSHDSQVSPRWWIVIVSRALVFWRLRDSSPVNWRICSPHFHSKFGRVSCCMYTCQLRVTSLYILLLHAFAYIATHCTRWGWPLVYLYSNKELEGIWKVVVQVHLFFVIPIVSTPYHNLDNVTGLLYFLGLSLLAGRFFQI